MAWRLYRPRWFLHRRDKNTALRPEISGISDLGSVAQRRNDLKGNAQMDLYF
jgi:hypothetical protein